MPIFDIACTQRRLSHSVSTTILEPGEASRMPAMISWAVFSCMSSCVTTTSGLVAATRSAASGPVEEVPTTSIPPREERMASRPSRNMVWSSARCTRTAASASPGVAASGQEQLLYPVEGGEHVPGADVGHVPRVPVRAYPGAEGLRPPAPHGLLDLHPEAGGPGPRRHPVGDDQVRAQAAGLPLEVFGGAEHGHLGAGAVLAQGEGERLGVHGGPEGYEDARFGQGPAPSSMNKVRAGRRAGRSSNGRGCRPHCRRSVVVPAPASAGAPPHSGPRSARGGGG